MSNLDETYSIIPPSGEFGEDWPVNFNIPQGASGGLSTGGWTVDNIQSGNFGNEGFIQQTFLGASITDFDLSAGFGDSPCTMSVNVVNDEFNISDGTPIGMGDDPYHNGVSDNFIPPVVGTPVFFKFGKNPATIEQAFRQTYDDLYNVQTLPKKINPNNAWGYNFNESDWDANDFNELPPYHMVDRVAGKIQDRTPLWDIKTYWRGRNHFNFGGILQSYTQNKGSSGKPVYSIQLTDPREILSNVEVLFNNYQGTTFNNKNLINLYGFLEYDPSPELLSLFESKKQGAGIIDKFVDPSNGNVNYFGVSAFWNASTGWEKIKPKSAANVQIPSRTWSNPNSSVNFESRIVNLRDQYYFGHFGSSISDGTLPEFFPITGQGFSRRSDKGIPFYRVSQGLAALFQYYGFLPQEYKNAGFGGAINFRGYNYVVDFSGIPTDKIPLLYYMDFDKLDLLSFAQELCDIISHSLYVSLLPVIDHPACDFLYKYNDLQVKNGTPENIIAGVIRLDAIDKTKQPRYGAIKAYLDELDARGINVQSQDVGYELSNVVTDKFVVGAQEVETYFFSNERDRDELWTYNRQNDTANMVWLQQFQWDLRTQEQQQILPYYGMLGNKAASVPRGFGSYQQILLDATSLNAYGVGGYYVATELELRAALISYEKWKEFLLSYNDIYIEDISEHRVFLGALSNAKAFNKVREKFANLPDDNAKQIVDKTLKFLENKQYAVTVPRCVWNSDRPYVTEDGYPASPCSPPFGYPLYYRRATSIGIVEAGVGSIVNAKTRLVKDTINLQKSFENINSPLLQLPKATVFNKLKKLRQEINELAKTNDPNVKSSPRYKALVEQLNIHTQVFDRWDSMKKSLEASNEATAFVENLENGPLGKFLFNIEKTAKKHEENAKKVYDFVKSVADECLGKKFLIRLPKSCNLGYSQAISTFGGNNFNIKNGPFGFPPKPISSNPYEIGGVYYDVNSIGSVNPPTALSMSLANLNMILNNNPSNLWHHYLQDYTSDKFFTQKRSSTDTYNFGALKGNYNPFSENWEWNYKPEPQGGFFGFNLFGVNISALQALRLGVPWSAMPPVVQQGLCPLDMTNLLSDSNRLQCYVRYNHSENLDFTAVSPNDMVQQVMTNGGQFISDIVQELPNNNIDNKVRFESLSQTLADQAKKERQPPSMAFVKCSVDEKLYLPPRLQEYSLQVFAEDYDFTLSIPEPKRVFTKNPDCTTKEDVQYPEPLPLFSIPRNGGYLGTKAPWVDFERIYDSELDSWIINTNIEELDDEHVYALITVPGRIRSLIDTRWNDGQNQMYQAAQLKHLMTQDTVQIPEFSTPTFPTPGRTVSIPCGPPPLFIPDYYQNANDYFEAAEQAMEDAARAGYNYGLNTVSWVEGVFGLEKGQGAFIPGKLDDWLKLSLEEITSARSITKQVIKGSIANNPNVRVNYTQPSPVYPDIVALPLMSMERCYGPWMSASQLDPAADARIKYSDIGGKVEFIKDENLAPWNYAGYQLMNEAGALQANFSNSLLLFSERGGFTFPDAPTGIALAKALKIEGPLITSIGVNVSQGGVNTTVKLDLYTAQWGKLAHQKEMAISQIARERQKLRDEQNSAIRRGLGKRATSSDLVNSVMNNGGKQVMNMINGITSQIETNKYLGSKISEGVIAVGADGGVAYNDPNDLSRAISTGDTKLIAKEIETHVITPAADMWRAITTEPSQFLPSLNYNTLNPLSWITNPQNHKPQ